MSGYRFFAATFATLFALPIGWGSLAACAARSLPVSSPEAASPAAYDGGDAAPLPSTEGGPNASTEAIERNDSPPPAEQRTQPCPTGMALVQHSFCIDVYEASLLETHPDGSETPFPHYLSPDGKTVRAVSVKGAFPQTFISEVQASAACEQSGKRLCAWTEWKTACMGTARTTFPYGESRVSNVCHDSGRNPVASVFPEMWAASLKQAKAAALKKALKPKKKKPTKKASSPKKKGTSTRAPVSKKPADVSQDVWTKLNDPRLGQVEGTLALTGEHDRCVNDYGVFDMVGNAHEWVATDLALEHGTFAGGYFLDTSINGDGCNYATRAHAHDYHDYSTGFRCCQDIAAP